MIHIIHAAQILVLLVFNTVIGAVVWALADDEQEQLLNRYLTLSYDDGWSPLFMLQLWPLALFFAWQIRQES